MCKSEKIICHHVCSFSLEKLKTLWIQKITGVSQKPSNLAKIN